MSRHSSLREGTTWPGAQRGNQHKTRRTSAGGLKKKNMLPFHLKHVAFSTPKQRETTIDKPGLRGLEITAPPRFGTLNGAPSTEVQALILKGGSSKGQNWRVPTPASTPKTQCLYVVLPGQHPATSHIFCLFSGLKETPIICRASGFFSVTFLGPKVWSTALVIVFLRLGETCLGNDLMVCGLFGLLVDTCHCKPKGDHSCCEHT